MYSFLQNLGFSILGSVLAWLLTLKLGETLKHKSWRWHFACLSAAFGVVFGGLLIFGRWQARVNPPSHVGSPSHSNPADVVGDNNGVARTTETHPNPSPEDVFVKNYLVTTNAVVLPKGRWAVVLRQNDESAPTVLTAAAIAALTSKGYKVVSVFRPEVFQEPGYRQLYGANSVLLQKLRRACDGIIIGEVKQTFSTDAGMQGLVTARLTLNVKILLTESGILKNQSALSARGGGFSQETAAGQASERLASDLKADLSLLLF